MPRRVASNNQPKPPRTAKRNLVALEKQRQVFELRQTGMSYEEIARRVGFAHAGTAYKTMQRAIRNYVAEPGEEVLKLELARLDQLFEANFTWAALGDLRAAEMCLKIMDRRARFLGLDKLNLNVALHIDPDLAERVARDYGLDPKEVIAEAERHLAEARALAE